jgi:TonB family protein
MITEEIGSDWVGRVVDGRFALLKWLGGSGLGGSGLGGSGSSGVFLTELAGHPSRLAAIKLIAAEGGNAEGLIDGWAAAAALSHPHLMPLLHSGRCRIDASELLYAVTEYAEENLAEILPERPLTPIETGEMLGPVLDALSYLHGKGLVHSRLKPSNILVVNGRLKLSCDNLHRAGEPGKPVLAPTVYDAPEAAARPIAKAVDLWSLGVVLVEALTQYPPVWDRSAQGEPAVPESMPQPFAGIARECLCSDPARRCTLSDVSVRLASARALPEQASKSGNGASGKLGITAGVASVLLLLAVVAGVLMQSRQNQPQVGPSMPGTEEQRPAPAIATHHTKPSAQSPAQTPVPGTIGSKAVAVKDGVVKQVMPDVLPSASASIHGQVNVRVKVAVDPGGNVSDASLDSPASSKYFSKVALQAAQQWKFKPAQADGQAVSSVRIVQFEFTQSGTEATIVEVAP